MVRKNRKILLLIKAGKNGKEGECSYRAIRTVECNDSGSGHDDNSMI